MRTLERTLVAGILASLSVLTASISGYSQTTSSPAQSAISPGVPVTSGPRIWLQQNQPLAVQHVAVQPGTSQGMALADTSALAGMGQSQPVSLVAGDLDGDGFDDLVVGYGSGGGGFISIHRGNIDAFAPQSEASFKAIGRGEFPSPFHLEAKTFSVSVRPDFIALGNFSGSSHLDLVLAASGDNVLYFFAGD